MIPDLDTLCAVAEATWPPAATHVLGPVTLREGQGGGKRVSAATATGPVTAQDVARAEQAMRARGQAPLFQVRAGEGELDAILETRGYGIVDPVNVLVAPVGALTEERPPRLRVFAVWEPLAIMRDIWAEGGIGPARQAVRAFSHATPPISLPVWALSRFTKAWPWCTRFMCARATGGRASGG